MTTESKVYKLIDTEHGMIEYLIAGADEMYPWAKLRVRRYGEVGLSITMPGRANNVSADFRESTWLDLLVTTGMTKTDARKAARQRVVGDGS